MGKFVDITGNKYGRLTVIERVDNALDGQSRWLCECTCGNTTIVSKGNLKSGNVKSCGCLAKEIKPAKTHGESRTRLYKIWFDMKRRCSEKYKDYFPEYHRKGIKVCKEWQTYEPFRDWALSHGYQDNLTIDRRDNDGNYEPNNCKWVDVKAQSNNRSSCIYITYNNKTQTMMQWCEELNLDYYLIHNRIHKLNWTFEKAISTPLMAQKRNKLVRRK